MMGERMDEMKGNIKEGVGKLTGNERLKAEGKADRLKGESYRAG